MKMVFKGGKPVDACPRCGCGEYYVNTVVSGTTFTCYQFDGSMGDNTHIYDGINYRSFKTAFCINCYKKLGTVKEVGKV